MVWHLVLLKPNPGLTDQDRQALINAFDTAVRGIPTVRDVHVGRRITHGASYEATAPDVADYFVTIAFDDLAGLQVYLSHPAHQELGALFSRLVSSALVHDFIVEGIEGMKRLGI